MLPLRLLVVPVGNPAHSIHQIIQLVKADPIAIPALRNSIRRAEVFTVSAAWSSGMILAQGARNPGLNSRSSPLTLQAMRPHPCRPASL